MVEVTRAWAPRGADHFLELVKTGFYDGARFFRVVRNYVVQFGINGDPSINSPVVFDGHSRRRREAEQRQRHPRLRAARAGQPHHPGLHQFEGQPKALDKDGFAPFGKVVSGLEVVESLYNSYGDMAPRGNGPDPKLIETQGNAYLESRFPRLDFIKKAAVTPGS